ncbi:hypothetical protein I302_100297 [Kwoniella bestiolae CBS 10118]|uniref:Pentatricopeptide repeat domain-containing protein n=1 Tax=Kwoniella bestiolae CBS 10118 TaxID=1296100 RepID=A0A1B9G4Q5_9TREE|nr:hypothetical protein I302_03669 [Kwoniella bestiolae CBS 10118]OCF25992.1 hypothetical protein I302_03669 [Kwoniella bestiolae CBS 10118]
MRAPFARQASRRLLPSLQQFRPPLCSRCLRAIQIRNNTYRSGNPQRERVRKASAEFSSRDRDRYLTHSGPSSSRSGLSANDTAIKDNFNALLNPSSSSSPPSINLTDPRKAVEVIYPLIFRRDLRPLLDDHLEQVSTVLTSSTDNVQWTNEELRQVTTILSHCWARSISLRHSTEKVELFENNYAEFVIHQALRSDHEGLKLILDLWESSLERQVKLDYVLGKRLIIAWAVLRTTLALEESPEFSFLVKGSGRENPGDGPSEVLGSAVGENGPYLKEYRNLVKLSYRYEWSQQRITREIHALRRKENYEGIIALWEKFKKDVLSLPHGSNIGGWMSPTERNDILSLFLLTFKRSSIPSKSFDTQFNDVVAHCSKPYPRDIAHTLLALRARPGEAGSTAKVGQEVLSLDHEDTQRSGSGNALDNMRSLWEQTTEKDLKMYMIYLEGLGRMGDLAGLKDTWNELVKDQKAREIYMTDEKLAPSSPFPPTQALNQMISSCLLIPDGSSIAIDLFSQAVSPSSSIPINLITINTILRHHARQGDLPSMSALFTLAEKLNLKPDIITYTTLVQGLLRGGKIDLAKKVLDDMSSQGIAPNERMFSMLISDLSKLGSAKSLSHAEELLNLMIKNKMRVNEVTWTGLISGYFDNGWIKNGWDTITRMERQGTKLNRVGYNICFRHFSSGSREGGIMVLWDKMLRDGIKPNSDSYLLVLTHLVKERNWKDAEKVLDDMRRRGFKVEKGALQSIVNRVRDRR